MEAFLGNIAHRDVASNGLTADRNGRIDGGTFLGEHGGAGHDPPTANTQQLHLELASGGIWDHHKVKRATGADGGGSVLHGGAATGGLAELPT